MIRNLKSLGLALAAVFALSAVAAAGASATPEQGYLTSDGPVTLHIDEVITPGNTFANSLTAFGRTIHCPGSTYTGHKYDETPRQLIPSGSTTATITPEYEEPCFVNDGRQATIDMNDCDFVLHLGKTTEPGNNEKTYGVTADVDCPNPANGIIVTMFGNGPGEAEGSDVCTLEITGETNGSLNQNRTGAHVTDQGNGHLFVSGTFHSIHVERSGLCVLLGGGTTTNGGEYHIDATVSGTDDEGNNTSISLSETVL